MSKSFRERVLKFWEAFTEEEKEVREMMDNKVEGETLLKFVDNILSIAFNTVYFEMGINNEGKYELILTPEGDKAKLLQLHYWLKMAPGHLWKKWNFYSSKPGVGKSNFGLTMFDISVDKDDVTIGYVLDSEREKLNIEVYAPKLMPVEENKRYSMFFILLDQFIGEINTMQYVGYIDFVEIPPVGNVVQIDEFKETIENTITEQQWLAVKDPAQVYTGYRLEPNESEGWKLREDAYIGATSCIPVINSFLNRDEEFLSYFEKDGLTYGFVFYENSTIEQEQMVPFRSAIEDKITSITSSQGIADTIGGATGFHFSYIDFIIYDKNMFLEIAKDVLTGYDLEQIGFATFRFGDKPELF
jgi:hypothetical protein